MGETSPEWVREEDREGRKKGRRDTEGGRKWTKWGEGILRDMYIFQHTEVNVICKCYTDMCIHVGLLLTLNVMMRRPLSNGFLWCGIPSFRTTFTSPRAQEVHVYIVHTTIAYSTCTVHIHVCGIVHTCTVHVHVCTHVHVHVQCHVFYTMFDHIPSMCGYNKFPLIQSVDDPSEPTQSLRELNLLQSTQTQGGHTHSISYLGHYAHVTNIYIQIICYTFIRIYVRLHNIHAHVHVHKNM